MTVKLHNVWQRSKEWHALRHGLITGTSAHSVLLTFAKDRQSGGIFAKVPTSSITDAANKNINLQAIDFSGYQKVQEQEGTTSKEHKERGQDLEPAAIDEFTTLTGLEVQDIGFVTNDKYPGLGCSPDGLVGDDAIIEIKCPMLANFHTACITLKYAYLTQIQYNLWITERTLCYAIIYNEHGKRYSHYKRDALIIKIHRDDRAIAVLEAKYKDYVAAMAQEQLKMQAIAKSDDPIIMEM